MLQVVTHNGLSPSQGGKRLGYVFSLLDGSTGAVPTTLASLLAPPPVPQKPVTEKVAMKTGVNGKTPQIQRDAHFADVQCPQCNEYVDARFRNFVICSCGQQIEAYD